MARFHLIFQSQAEIYQPAYVDLAFVTGEIKTDQYGKPLLATDSLLNAWATSPLQEYRTNYPVTGLATLRVLLTTFEHYQALRAFLTEHYDLTVVRDGIPIYDYDAKKGAQIFADKKAMLEIMPPRFSLTVAPTGEFSLLETTPDSNVSTYFTGWPFHGCLKEASSNTSSTIFSRLFSRSTENSSLRYSDNNHRAEGSLATLEDWQAMRKFVAEMRPAQILRKTTILSLIDTEINKLALHEATAAVVPRPGTH